jgi:hypothetical protein
MTDDAHAARKLIARLDLDGLCAALRADRIHLTDGDARRLVRAPVLASGAARLAVLEALGPEPGRTSAGWALSNVLIPLLRDHPPAMKSLARLQARHADQTAGAGSLIGRMALEALFALGHRPTIERVARRLAPTIKAARPRWDPHHTIMELREPIRATFALDPATATARFARYFTARGVRSEAGAKVAHDILRLGLGEMTFHGATRLGTGVNWLRADPGWRALLAPLEHDRRLKAVVRRALAAL